MIVCDICGKELEKKLTHDSSGVVCEVAVSYKTALWNTDDIFPHLCLSCANKLDRALEKQQIELVRFTTEAEKRVRLNKARRERIGTKG